MKGTCEKCGKAYSFETENIDEFIVTFRCKSCRHIGKASHHGPRQLTLVALEELEYQADTKIAAGGERKG